VKVWLRKVLGARTGGPFSFAGALTEWLISRGDAVTHDLAERGIDIALAMNAVESRDLRRLKWRRTPLVMRADNVPFNTPGSYFEHAMARVRRCYQVADAVIFQSDFARRIVERSFGPPGCEHRVIPNGVDLNLFTSEERTDGGKSVLTIACASVWRPHKRLSATVRAFLRFHERRPESRLIVIGPTDRAGETLPEHPVVEYAGALSHEETASRLREADLFVHLAWLDCCPNVVIEAQAMGLPVICASGGGTKEILVKGAGRILDTDPDGIPPTRTNIYDPDVIPAVPASAVAEAIAFVAADLPRQRKVLAEARENLGIGRAGEEYRRFFDAVRNGAVARPRGRGFWALAAGAAWRRLKGGGRKGGGA